MGFFFDLLSCISTSQPSRLQVVRLDIVWFEWVPTTPVQTLLELLPNAARSPHLHDLTVSVAGVEHGSSDWENMT